MNMPFSLSEAVNERAAKEGCSGAALIRRAVLEYLGLLDGRKS